MESAAHWVPPPGCPTHSSDTPFSSSSSIPHPNLLFHLSGIPFIQYQNLKNGNHPSQLSFFHSIRPPTLVGLIFWVFIDYVTFSPFLLCILSSIPVQIASCLQTCLSQAPPTLLPEWHDERILLPLKVHWLLAERWQGLSAEHTQGLHDLNSLTSPISFPLILYLALSYLEISNFLGFPQNTIQFPTPDLVHVLLIVYVGAGYFGYEE